VITRHPQRIKRLILTNCDAYEAFPPFSLRGFLLLPRIPGGIWGFVQSLRLNFVQKVLVALLAKTQMEIGVRQSLFQPLIRQQEIRRDLHKFMYDVSNRYTKEAALQFSSFKKPVLLVWGKNDPFFTTRLAERLNRDFPDARLHYVDNSRTFVSEDQPAKLAEHIHSFLHSTSEVAR
jgi:pimeloyl-ACP methyl ester carboxylesterase